MNLVVRIDNHHRSVLVTACDRLSAQMGRVVTLSEYIRIWIESGAQYYNGEDVFPAPDWNKHPECICHTVDSSGRGYYHANVPFINHFNVWQGGGLSKYSGKHLCKDWKQSLQIKP
jgi:hypothetical protein